MKKKYMLLLMVAGILLVVNVVLTSLLLTRPMRSTGLLLPWTVVRYGRFLGGENRPKSHGSGQKRL